MVRDAEQVRRDGARRGGGGGSESGDRVRIAEYELSDEEFAVFAKQTLDQAQTESARRKGS